jgi:hypothetical protein
MIKIVLNSITVQNSPLLQEFATPEGYVDLTEFATFFEEEYGFRLTNEDFKNSTLLARSLKQFKTRKGEFDRAVLPIARQLFPAPSSLPVKSNDTKVVIIDLDGLYLCRTCD